ncbi:MAG: hypothetical protein AAGC78_15125 [Cellvibrio sp.]|uniref:RipA family octameric membrane protein n=1 Tax=Cellvibrio sp. TaxID=1965322 RepID=UPI0031ACC8A2
MTKPVETAEQYGELFKDKSSEALKCALDIRKFEIDLYWKRASYFWVLIGAALVAFIAVAVAKDASHREELRVVISSLGLVFSCAWLAVNKGSKFWQENWEKHVDMLEDGHMGPLYKTVFNNDKGFFSLGGSVFSVSRVNLMISFYVVFLWFGLFVASLVSVWHHSLLTNYSDILVTVGAIFSLFCCCLLLFFKVCKTKINFEGEESEKIKAVLRGKPLP